MLRLDPITRPSARPPLVGDRRVELRRAGVAAAKVLMRRRSGFQGWLHTVQLRNHPITSCGCGLINCR